LNAQIPLDSFLDAASVANVERIVRAMLREKGFQFADVAHRVVEIPGTTLVHLTFVLEEGPHVRVRRISFDGASTGNEHALRVQMKGTRIKSPYLEARFDEDADRILQYYRDNGYITATVGTPELKTLEDSADRRTRWVELRIAVAEGTRYKVGEVTFAGNHVIAAGVLQAYFRLRPNDYYNDGEVRQGLNKAREIYGARGYFDFTAYPDLSISHNISAPDAASSVDVTIRLSEGSQYFINRIVLNGNTVTRDAVVRRELGLVEGDVLNMEALKTSVRRVNQLGYFKPLTERDVTVEKTPGVDNHVDVALRVEELNRDHATFGGGVSQAEGLFGNVSYATPNFLGRGQNLTLLAQQGSRSNLYEATLAEPYLFGGPLRGAISAFAGKTSYDTSTTTSAYAESRKGATFSIGKSVAPFARVNFGYTYEVVNIGVSGSLLAGATGIAAGIPALSAADNGRHVDGRLEPSFVYNTIDSPFLPHAGIRLTAGVQLASRLLGGGYDYVKPTVEAVWYRPTGWRTGFGLRGQGGILRTYGATTDVPYYLRYFLGGETQIRGTDIRTVGPLDADNRALGGNRFVLFNTEYHVDLSSRIRVLAFHDAGQAFDSTHPFRLGDLRTSTGVEVRVAVPVLNIPLRFIYYWNPSRDSFQPSQGFRFSIGTTF
jgi:outer membrane protein insertion porin family